MTSIATCYHGSIENLHILFFKSKPLFSFCKFYLNKATTRLLHNIQSSTHPEDSNNPLGGSNKIAVQHTTSIHTPCRWEFPTRRQQDFSAAGTSPTGRSICMSRCWDFPHSETTTQTCPRVFLDRPTGIKTLRYWIFPTRSPPQGLSPLRGPL